MTIAQSRTGELFPLKQSIARPSIPVYLFHRFQERIRNPRTRKRLSGMIALFRGRRTATPMPDMTTLNRDGTLMLPGYLSPERAAKLRAVLETMPCRDPWKADRGTFALADAPVDTHVADIAEAPLLMAAHDIAFDERLLALAAEYFGSTPYVDSIQAWWSLASSGQPEEAENFHRDNDGIRFLKFFLYLTDVDGTQGPHKFVLGSHVEPRLLDRRRLTDTEVEEAFGTERIRTVMGRAGDAFIEDTFGVHKGQQPASGTRLLLQVRYSITPTIFRSRMTVDAPVPDRASRPISLIHDA
ncbi:phytanoyl-CoA dioxygenase family protein [Sphingomonas sp. CFBP 8764]|uniref:phytanoyl-CoA dioxygenase family protein n=1 Tax=Sphingomonas sp. CFBP 8764 TaxID=2775275 RepID=UPI00177C1598|nr:phytanoyl-CoA dioxygenase family protein [Sphingomonas sp. CFBP 8764]MBD8552717.1 phytanoyl-CoA dioxygenase family protein [Sphingomonas sp. CFBP 8764]